MSSLRPGLVCPRAVPGFTPTDGSSNTFAERCPYTLRDFTGNVPRDGLLFNDGAHCRVDAHDHDDARDHDRCDEHGYERGWD